MRFSSYKNQQGFTLIEIIVSLAIFSVVALIAVGALLKIVATNKQAQRIQAAVTNISFALESMSREIRTASVIHCDYSTNGTLSGTYGQTLTTQNCGQSNGTIPATIIAFVSSNPGTGSTILKCNLVYAYRFYTTGSSLNEVIHLQKAEQPNCDTTIDDNSFTDIISTADAYISTYYMSIVGSPYPLFTVGIRGHSGSSSTTGNIIDIMNFAFQTSVSPRIK